MIYLCLAGLLLCIIGSNYFSSSEMAYSSCNRLRLESARDGGSKRAAIAVRIIDRFDDTLSAILIGNNLVNIAASSIGSVLVILIAGDDRYAWVSTVVITVLVIIFGETMPKIIAKNSANRIALSHAYFVHGLTIILMPLIWVVVGLTKLITSGFKGEEADSDEEAAAMEEPEAAEVTAETEEAAEPEAMAVTLTIPDTIRSSTEDSPWR